MLNRLFAPRRPITSAQGLMRFLGENAALVAQKTVIGYCHARTSLPLSELMRDKPFADAFEKGRTQAFIAVLEDMVVIAEGRLRPAAGERAPQLADALAAQVEAPLRDSGVALDPEALGTVRDRLRSRLAAAQSEPPKSIADISQASGQRVFEAMPIHERFRRQDREPIVASVRFLMVGMANEFDRRLDAPQIAADLLRAPSAQPG